MKVSKYPPVFTSMLLALAGLFSFVFVKYYPFLFKSLIYHCEHLDCSRLVRISTEAGVMVFKLMILFIALTVVKLAVNYYRVTILRRKLLKTVVKINKINPLIKSLGLDGKVIVVDYQDPFAFCLGFAKPKIVLSSTLINIMCRSELRAVLDHEKYHLEHRDAVVSLLAKSVQSLSPFFPLVSDFVNHYSLEREVKADELAIRAKGGKGSLISALKKILRFDSPPAFSTIPAFTGAEALEARIRSLTRGNNGFRFFTPKSFFLSTLSFIVLLGLAFAPLHTFIQGEDKVAACVSIDSCTNSCLKQTGDNLFNLPH